MSRVGDADLEAVASFTARRVLVTGAAGFLGCHLSEALVAGGAEVAALDLPSRLRSALEEGRLSSRVASLECDLTADGLGGPLAELRPDIVFHLAGHASVPASIVYPDRDYSLNVAATFGLLNTIRRLQLRPAIINASSAAVYGVGGEDKLREDKIAVPTSPYGASKLCTEIYLHTFCRAYGLKGASVRLFPVYGPHLRRHVVFDLLEKLTRNPKTVEIQGDGYQVREFLYVSDCVEAMLTIAARGALRGESYNAAGGSPVTIRELVAQLAENLTASPTLVFTGKNREGTRDSWVADGSRLRALGFTPKVTLAEGLEKTIEWFNDKVAPELAS